MEKNSV